MKTLKVFYAIRFFQMDWLGEWDYARVHRIKEYSPITMCGQDVPRLIRSWADHTWKIYEVEETTPVINGPKVEVCSLCQALAENYRKENATKTKTD